LERSVVAQREALRSLGFRGRPLRRIFHSEAEKNVAGADPAACLRVVFALAKIAEAF